MKTISCRLGLLALLFAAVAAATQEKLTLDKPVEVELKTTLPNALREIKSKTEQKA